MRKSNITYTSRRRQSLPISRSYGRNSNITIFEPNQKIGIFSKVLITLGFFVLLGFIYAMSATQPTTYSDRFQEIDNKIADLEVRKNDLEVENARLTSLNAIEGSEVAQNMTTPTSVNYAN